MTFPSDSVAEEFRTFVDSLFANFIRLIYLSAFPLNTVNLYDVSAETLPELVVFDGVRR